VRFPYVMVRASRGVVLVLAGACAVAALVYAAVVPNGQTFALGSKATPFSLTVFSSSSLPPEVQAQEAASAPLLFDRDTTTQHVAFAQSSVQATFEAAQVVRGIKVFGAAPYTLTVKADNGGSFQTISGLENLNLTLLPIAWNSFNATVPATTTKLMFVLTPATGGTATGLGELEVWSTAAPATAKNGAALLTQLLGPTPPTQGRLYNGLNSSTTPTQAVVTPGDNNTTLNTNTFRFTLDRDPAHYVRAYLTYELFGQEHYISARRLINQSQLAITSQAGGTPVLPNALWSTQVERINPAGLVRGVNTLQFKVLNTSNKDSGFTVRNVRVVAELDSGANAIETITANQPDALGTNAVEALYDGDLATGWRPYPTDQPIEAVAPSIDFVFRRPTQMDAVSLYLSAPLPGQVQLSVKQGGLWSDLPAEAATSFDTGWNTMYLPATIAPEQRTYEAVRLTFSGVSGTSVAEIREFLFVGSGVGGRTTPPKIFMPYPDAGQFYARAATVQGFVEPWNNGSGNASISVAGAGIAVAGGTINTVKSKDDAGFATQADSDPWFFDIKATWPNGESVTTTIQLNKQMSAASPATGALAAGLSSLVTNKAKKTVANDGTTLVFDAGTVATDTTVTINPLAETDVPALDVGMVNVTKGPRRGYRYLPHGSKFLKPVAMAMPYDKALIPPGHTEDDVKTFYFDDQAGRWVDLPFVSVDKTNKVVNSTTDHFTDMINAVVTVPDHPQTVSFNPTSMKDIKAADPGAQVNLIEPPKANNQGDARLSYPIEVPPGRLGLQPQLAVSYSSSGGNGWMGIGWDMPMQAVTIDTRFGVPRYDAGLETETYMLSGEMLTPVAHRGDLVARTTDKVFHTRVEGQFRRIIRKGTAPSNYTWEVTDKNGVKYLYGATDPATETLTDASGNIFTWALCEIRDPNGNFVRYHYAKVSDPGRPDWTVPGSNLYVQRITYTGSGGVEGLYAVNFIRDRDLNEPKRSDVQIDARGGFKRVTADLLRKVEVSFAGALIRRYEFVYNDNPYGDKRADVAFNKTLLTAINQFAADGALFNRHTLTYYDEARDPGSNYRGFAGATNWNVGNDNIGVGLMGQGTASALGGSQSTSAGGHLYIGVGVGDEDSKEESAGIKIGFSQSRSETLIAMADMNGDGLPDKVFKGGGGFSYRPNQSGPNGATSFGSPVPLPTLPAISKERVTSTTFGIESYFVVPVMIDFNVATTQADTYFTDVNGDGITDLVSGGSVLFGYINAAGVPTFSANSADTPVAIGAGAIETANLLEDAAAIEAERAANFPLLDTLRRWIAPYDGTITINAPVRLIQDTSPERAAYTGADGVRVAIQLEGSELWSADIPADSYDPRIPTGVSAVPVTRGQRLYFRVQSKFDGAFDQVAWDPYIAYVGVDAARTDVNSLPEYRYQASTDFTLAGRGTAAVKLPLTGTLHLAGRFEKGATTDDVTLLITRNGFDVYRRSFGFAESTVVDLSQDLAVTKLDVLKWQIFVDSPIDAAQVKFAPGAYYTAAQDLTTLTDEQGNFVVQVNPPYDMDLYPISSATAPQGVYTVPTTGTLPVQARVQVSGLASGQISSAVFTVKRRGALLAKQPVTVTGTGDPTVEVTVTTSVDVAAGDELFFDLSSRDPLYGSRPTTLEVKVGADLALVPSATHTREANGALFPQPYRGWGAAGYNGNAPRDALPIDQSLLLLNGSFDPNTARAYPYSPRAADALWGGVDDLAWVKAGSASSSRLGLDDIRMPRSEQFAGQSAPARISRSTNTSGSLAVGGSKGSSESKLEFQDLNGDRFPDVISNGGVQFTRAAGGLESGRRGSGPGSARKANNESFNASTESAGNISRAIGAARGLVVTDGQKSAQTGKQGADMSPIGFGGDISHGTSESDFDLLDINGDGLPDKVSKDGSVALNLGYSFAPAEPWGGGVLSFGKTDNVGVNIGYNTGFYSLAGGLNLGVGTSHSDEVYTDINGDGLPDKVVAGSVRLNTGNGFTGQIPWPGGQGDIAVDKHISLGGGVFITFGFSYFDIKIVFNPGLHLDASLGRPEVAFRDMDGDGFADHVRSTIDSQLSVALNPIGRTNLLKRVLRPLGATFDLEYIRDGNTYDLPQSRWLMTKVMMFDGHVGEGVDTQLTTYRYLSPKYNRLERDFYGYGSVVEEHRDMLASNALYRSIAREFRNDSYYTKGLMAREVLQDAAGRPFTETENTYVVRDEGTGQPLSDLQNTVATGFPQLTRTDRRFYEGLLSPTKTTFTTHTYDSFGNIATFTDAGEIGAQDDVLANVTYTNCQPAYIIKPNHIDVRGNGALMRLRDANIDCTTGNLTQVRQSLADLTAAATDLTYFPNGNLQSVTGPANKTGQRYVVTYQYDPTVATHVTRATDSFGLSSSATHNLLFGKVVTATDTNNNQVTNAYDSVGRLQTIFGPYEQGQTIATLSFEFHPEATVPYAITRHVDKDADGGYKNTGTIDTILFIDGLKRVIQTKKDATVLEGNANTAQDKMIVSGQATFDAFGRTVTHRYPTTEQKASEQVNAQFNGVADTIAPTAMVYDVLDRNTRTTIPDGTFTTIGYGFGLDRQGLMQFETTVTDANVNAGLRGAVTRTYRDVRELISSLKEFVRDASGAPQPVWTSYAYDALKQIRQVTDDKNNVTTVSYDNFGRRTVIDNPDTGRTEIQYDLASNVTKKVTANLRAQSKSIDYSYDFNRLAAITYPNFAGNNVSYAYGAPGAPANTAGRLTRITSQMGVEERQYGKLGETVYEKKTVTTFTDPLHPSVYETRFNFETFGRLLRITYPDGEIVTNTYDSGGNLTHAEGVKGSATGPKYQYRYLQNLYYDKFEQRAFVEQGNGVKTSYTYNAQTRRLAGLAAGSQGQGNTLFQNLSYSYDKVGNILGLKNDVALPHANDYGGPSIQRFEYDDLYRLTKGQGVFPANVSAANADVGACNGVPTSHCRVYSLDLTYDTIHNMQRKNQLDTRYPPSGTAIVQKKTTYNFPYAYNASGPGSIRPHAPNHIDVRTYTYDANGNQLGWTHDTNGTRRDIVWDDENRIQSVFDNGHEKTYKYDDKGQRMIKRGPQGETVYVNQFFTDRPGANGTKHVYAGTIRIASKLMRQDTPGANPNGKTPFEKDLYFYHPDHLGSSNYVTDLNGKLYEHLEYFPFGESWIEENTNVQRTPYLFTAKEFDEETGLYYYGARYYDPRTSVWQSADPMLGKYLPVIDSNMGMLINRGVYGSKNLGLYTYAGANPIVLSDPDGLAPTKTHGELATTSAGLYGFSPTAAREIAYWNMDTDLPGKVTWEAGEPTPHEGRAAVTFSFWKSFFTNDVHATSDTIDMKKSTEHIDGLVDQAVSAALAGRPGDARKLLGKATHTAEDQPFHKGINIFKHMVLSAASWVVELFTGTTPDFDPDKVTGAKTQQAIQNDFDKVYGPFSDKLRQNAASPEDAAKAERQVLEKPE